MVPGAGRVDDGARLQLDGFVAAYRPDHKGRLLTAGAFHLVEAFARDRDHPGIQLQRSGHLRQVRKGLENLLRHLASQLDQIKIGCAPAGGLQQPGASGRGSGLTTKMRANQGLVRTA